MGRLLALVGAAAISCAVMPAGTGAGSEPREPCIPPGTYSPALGGHGPQRAANPEAGRADEPVGPGSAGGGIAVDVPEVDVVCTPVGVAWPPRPEGEAQPSPPRLAVVMTDFRPKDVSLVLDGRPIGRARDFNGNNGFLFLEPGRYRLEAQLGGYESAAFRIDARPDCRYDIRHRLTRIRGARKEQRAEPAARLPLQRVYGPVTPEAEKAPRMPVGPDANLRPDLSGKGDVAAPRASRPASLRLHIAPVAAAVHLDGEFIATGDELDRLVSPLAIAAGPHLLVVSAPGYQSREVEFSAPAGEVTELDVVLEPKGAE